MTVDDFDLKHGFEDSFVPIVDADPGDEAPDTPKPAQPVDVTALLGDLHTYIVSSLDLGEYLSEIGAGSRELTNALTRLEEAEFWVLKGTMPQPAQPPEVDQ